MAGIFDLLAPGLDAGYGDDDPFVVGNPVPINFGFQPQATAPDPYVVGNPVPITFPSLTSTAMQGLPATGPLSAWSGLPADNPFQLRAPSFPLTPGSGGGQLGLGGSPFGGSAFGSGSLGMSGRNSGYGGSYGAPQAMPSGMPAGFGGSQASPFGASPFGSAGTMPGVASAPSNMPAGRSGSNSMPFSIPDGGVYGMSKWLPGSQGADIFLPRGSPIRANQGGTVLKAMGGTGLSQGAEMIVQFDDGTMARFRHVQPGIQGGRFKAGQVLGTVNDSSMDMLSRQVAQQIGAPDGFQHLDLSISRSGNFDPTGGGGGDINSAQWLQSKGYRGKVVGQTPGPQQGMSGGMGGLGMGGGMFGPMGMPGMGGPMGMMGGMPPMMGGGMPGMGMPPMMGMGGLGMGGLGMGGPLMGGMGMPGGMGMGMPMMMGGTGMGF